ncbi:F-box only protein 41 [Astyanax mexicanus]|uniref:F-box only protein 41 n=1 Tax=Astyanax mexicanus TaxID=7994 RepID=UPI0020CB2D15|nr:F-box only protein 41 [Astyanax mexicanus]
MATTTSLSLHCPDCGEPCGFGDPQTGHTCRKICLIPRRKSEGAVVAVSAQQQCSPLGHSPISQPLRLELLDALSLASSAAVPLSQLLVRRHAPSFSPLMAVAVSAEPRSEQVVAQLNVPWGAWGRLAVEARLQQLALEVQHRVSSRLSSLQEEVKRRSVEVRRARRESERMEREKREAEQRAAELARQVDVSVEMLASLRQELMEREEELNLKHQEVCELDRFVRDTAFREASAKIRLQGFIEDLLERAERAEKQLQNLHTHSDTGSPHGHLVNRGVPYQRSYSVSGMSRCCYQQYDRRGSPLNRYSGGRMRTLSVGSGGCEVDWDGAPTSLEAQYYHVLCEGLQGSPQRAPPSPFWTPHTQTEGDSDSWSIYTTESQEDLHHHRHYRTYSKSAHSSIHCPSCHHSNKSSKSMMCSERMRMRAWLFCVFTYLDTRSLLTAAQVCRDWWSVARHPAVWTRVSLENARISSKFLVTLSQWCSQTQSLSLQNLKPRSRNRKESKEEYQKSTRGCLEVGLEAVLKSAGRSLLSLTISHCPNILTDRSLWLVSCHCRALRTLTYRSSSDPVGQEVIWALGAGCRDITNLHTAPLQPCQQPSRFSNRCLQTIGRCWPNLQQVGVGGAGCGIQGLASLVRNCAGVTVLELDHMSEISQEGAAELCREGLQHLHMLIFISTPVTPKALLHFNSVCVKLKNIVVQMSIADYFEDAESEEAKRLFEEIVSNLQALRKRPGLADILQIKVDRP